MKKKILHIVGKASYDGTSVFALRLAQHLKDYSSEIIFITNGSAACEIKNLNINYIILSELENKSVYSKIILLIKFKIFLIKNRFDIIHYHSGGISFLLAAVFLKRKGKLIHHLHCGNINCKPSSPSLSFSEKKIYSFIDKLSLKIASASHVAAAYKSYFAGKEIFTINNAVPFSFQPKSEMKYSIGYLGQINSFKNIEALKILAEVIKVNFKNLRIIIKGDVSANLTFINEYKDIITIESPSFDVDKFFNKIDILFFPSENPVEGAPLVLIEALAFDKGIIAKETKAVSEILGNYPLLVNDFSKESLTAALSSYYSGVNKFSELHKKISEKYSYPEMLTQIENLYKSI